MNYLGTLGEQKHDPLTEITQANNIDENTAGLINKLEPKRQNNILKQMKCICEQIAKFISLAVETKPSSSENIDLPSMIVGFSRDQRQKSEVIHIICL